MVYSTWSTKTSPTNHGLWNSPLSWVLEPECRILLVFNYIYMQRAWEKAGSEVEYVNERLMRITVLLEDRLFQVISVYAPTLI